MKDDITFILVECAEPFRGKRRSLRDPTELCEEPMLPKKSMEPILVRKQGEHQAEKSRQEDRPDEGNVIIPLPYRQDSTDEKKCFPDKQDGSLRNTSEDQGLHNSFKRRLSWMCRKSVENPRSEKSRQQSVNHAHKFTLRNVHVTSPR
jgi:hypothetical protein